MVQYRRRRRARPANYETWKSTPLNAVLRAEMDRQDITSADLGRMIGAQSSLISRWMQGRRPNPESLVLVSDALGLDLLELLVLAEYIPAKYHSKRQPRLQAIMSKLDSINWTKERFRMIEALVNDAFAASREEDERRERTKEEQDEREIAHDAA